MSIESQLVVLTVDNSNSSKLDRGALSFYTESC